MSSAAPVAKKSSGTDADSPLSGTPAPQSAAESATEPAAGPAPRSATAPAQVALDETKATAAYANFCRVTGTPEELIIDFGLNAQPFGTPTSPIAVSQRLIVNFYTAKRLLAALQMTLQRHEAAFGVLETDVQKRVMPSVLRQAAGRG